MSTISPALASPIQPIFNPNTSDRPESPALASLITNLSLQPHPEGGYFVETDRDPLRVPNPFLSRLPSSGNKQNSDYLDNPPLSSSKAENQQEDNNDTTRSASTTIFYLLTPRSPIGVFHMNKARTMHTLHSGRGRYVIIHPPSPSPPPSSAGPDPSQTTTAKVETFLVGHNVAKGEKLQWLVEGGVWKASFLLPSYDQNGNKKKGSVNSEGGEEEEEGGLLISETVVPGFEFCDHDFLRREQLEGMVTGEQVEEMGWLVRKTLKN